VANRKIKVLSILICDNNNSAIMFIYLSVHTTDKIPVIIKNVLRWSKANNQGSLGSNNNSLSCIASAIIEQENKNVCTYMHSY
jgi:hypothetical protein